MKLFSDKRGAVTPMLAIIVAAIIFLNFTIFDALRIKALLETGERTEVLAASSVLSKFDRGLLERYGLYCLREDEKDALENRFREILEASCTSNDLIDLLKNNGGLDFNIMNYEVTNAELTLTESLGDKDVLKNEICELMQYKSVTNGIEKIADKLKTVLNLSKEVDAYSYANDLSGFVELVNMKMEMIGGIINGDDEDMDDYSVNGYFDSQYHDFNRAMANMTLYQDDVDYGVHTEETIEGLITMFEFGITGFEVYSMLCENALDALETLMVLKTEVTTYYNKVKAKLDAGEIVSTDQLTEAMKNVEEKVINCDFRAIHTKLEQNFDVLNEAINYYEDFEDTLEVGSLIDSESISDMCKKLADTDKSYKKIEFNSNVVKDISEEENSTVLAKTDIGAEAEKFFGACNNSIPENIYNELPSKDEKSETLSIASFLSNFGNGESADIFKAMIENVKEDYEINDYIATYFYDASEAKDYSEHYLMGEVEYIMFGESSDKANLMAAYIEIAALRTVLNIAHILSDSEKNDMVDAAAKAMATATEGMGEAIYKGVIVMSWATTEAAYDLTLLQQGEKVPLVKTSADWNLSIDGTLSEDWAKEEKTNITDMSYSEYINLLLCLVPQSAKLARIQDLLELNLYKKTNNYTEISDLYTSIDAKAKYSFDTFAIINKDGKHCYSWEQKTSQSY